MKKYTFLPFTDFHSFQTVSKLVHQIQNCFGKHGLIWL